MKRHGDELYDMIASRDNVERALHNAAQGVRSRPAVQRCLDNADDAVSDICKILSRCEFHTGEYRARTIYEPKERKIHILPFFPDRIVQHALVDVVAPAVWEPTFIFDSYACRKGKGQTRGVLRAAQFVRRHDFDWRYDIRSFYHSIDHEILKSLIERKIKGRRTLGLCFDIIDSWHESPGKGCPIGNLTSQWFGNVYMNALDHFAKEELGIKAYVRYCDDFHVFGDDKSLMRWWDACISAFVRDELRLEFSKHNLSRTKDGCDFLGYRMFPDKILVRRSTAKRIRRRINGIRRILNKSEALRHDQILSMLGSVSSSIGVLSHAQAHNLSVSMKLAELRDELSRRHKEFFLTWHPRNTRGRENKDAGCAEQADSDDADRTENITPRGPRRKTRSVCNDTILFCRRRISEVARVVYGVKKHSVTARQPEHGVSVLSHYTHDGKVVLPHMKTINRLKEVA